MSSDEITTTSDLKDVAVTSSVVQVTTIVVSAVRNVQTQHGDYRSVDEENIVVLRNCLSPVPTRAAKPDCDDGTECDAEADSDWDTEQVVWIEPFSEVGFYLLVCFV